jgi:hypothetical protein
LPGQDGYKYEKIVKHEINHIGCNEFRTSNYGICGCDNVPRKFWKYRAGNNYEDTIAYYDIPHTSKLGVRIIR